MFLIYYSYASDIKIANSCYVCTASRNQTTDFVQLGKTLYFPERCFLCYINKCRHLLGPGRDVKLQSVMGLQFGFSSFCETIIPFRHYYSQVTLV